MEIKIGELEVDNNRFKVEIDELRVARNQVKTPSQTFFVKNGTLSCSISLFLDRFLYIYGF